MCGRRRSSAALLIAARCCGLAVALAAPAASAHSGGHHGPPTLAGAWSLSPWLLLPLAVLVVLYVAGLARLWRRAGTGRGIAPRAAVAFTSGVLVLLLATTWPLDALGEWSLGAHMAQHMLLLAVVPPLLLAGRPFAAAAHALPRAWAIRLHATTSRAMAAAGRALVPASIAHGLVMWCWHLPVATDLALANDLVHWLMHASFLAAGLWFWAALWQRIRAPDSGAGAGVLALVAVMMQMGFLGALLTFATRPLYPVYVLRAPQLGLDPLIDQQIAGLVMWVPSCVPYLLGALWLLWHGFARLAVRDGGAPRARQHAGRRTRR